MIIKPKILTPKLNIVIGPPKRKPQRKLFWDHAVFINLDYRTDRLEHMKNELKFIGIEAERINATKKYGLSKLERYHENKLSHMEALDIMERNNYEKMLILEDDAVFHNDFWNILNKAIKQLPNEWDMLFLGAFRTKKHKYLSENIIRVYNPLGVHAYIVTRRVINLLKTTLNDDKPIDQSWCGLYKTIMAICIYPKIAIQYDNKSDLSTKIKHDYLPNNFNHSYVSMV